MRGLSNKRMVKGTGGCQVLSILLWNRRSTMARMIRHMGQHRLSSLKRDPIRDAIPHSLPDTRTQLNSYGQIVCPVLHTSSRLCCSGAESQRNSPCDYVNQDRRQGTVEPASARHSAVGCGRTRPERLTRSFCWGSVGIGTKTPADPSAPPDGLGPAFRPLLHVSNFQGMHEN